MSVIGLSLIYRLFLIINIVDQIVSSSPDRANQTNEPYTRIIGGRLTNIKSKPFMVFIQRRHRPNAHCGGTNIRARWVLTAAHCLIGGESGMWTLVNPWNYVVIAGSSTIAYSPTWQVHNVQRVVPHPRYSASTMSHDIGLVELVKPFRINKYVQYVRLPPTFDTRLFDRRRHCEVLGWGQYTSTPGKLQFSDRLRVVSLEIMSNEKCNTYENLMPVAHDQICAGRDEGGFDSCQGDSGGPLLCNNVQVGVVSWGHGCALPLSPGVYTRVDLFLYWINGTIMKSNSWIPIYSNFPLVFLLTVLMKLIT